MSTAAEVAAPRARLMDWTPAEYHTDPCPIPSLSSSIAHTLCTRSPLHAWTEHPRFGNIRGASSEAQNDGSIIHKLLLGKGVDLEVITGADNFRTKAAQIKRDDAIAAGRIPILEHRYNGIQAAAETIRANLVANDVTLDGQSEVTIEWYEEGADGPVLCRSLVDHLRFDCGQIIDLKKITSADSYTCSRHAYEYGYDIQHAAYSAAVAALRPEFVGRVDFVFAFMELDPPYAVVPVRPDGILRELGALRWRRAVEIWERCTRENRWPSYTSGITTLEAPPWALAREGL